MKKPLLLLTIALWGVACALAQLKPSTTQPETAQPEKPALPKETTDSWLQTVQNNLRESEYHIQK